MRLWQRMLGAAAVVITAAVLAPAAMASVSGSQTLDQSGGTSAGGTHNLGLTLNFSDSGTDSPQHLTLKLPPGLLANTAVDGGQCLKSNQTPNSACQIGSGTVTVHPNITLTSVLGLPIPVPASVPISVTFYLVPPPAGSDLAGIEVYSSQLSTQIGSTGPITVRPSGDPDGVGATVALTLPDTLPPSVLGPLASLVNGSVGISITTIQSTFDNLRYPATCPAQEPFVSSFDSYQDSTVHTVSSALSVTNCSALSYNPQFSATATRDTSDDSVAVTTNITQGATEAPNRSVSLVFPTSVFAPDLRALKLLCLSSVSSCTPVGTVTAVSPLYPTALTGQAYLTGTGSGLTLTLTFPSPFPLTLVGTVSLLTNTASFSGLPDIPLSQLKVALNGGDRGLFATGCNPPTGTATARLVDQNGDQSRSDASKFTVANCPGVKAGSGGSGSGSGSAGPGGSGSSASGSTWSANSSGSRASVKGTSLTAKSIFGLAKGKPSLRFVVAVSRRYAKFTRLTVMLPSGLRVRSHRVHKRTVIRGVTLRGAKVRSLRLSHGHLQITLRRPERRVTVTIGSSGMRETRALRALAQTKKLKRLRLKVAVRDVKHHTRTLTVTLRDLHL